MNERLKVLNKIAFILIVLGWLSFYLLNPTDFFRVPIVIATLFYLTTQFLQLKLKKEESQRLRNRENETKLVGVIVSIFFLAIILNGWVYKLEYPWMVFLEVTSTMMFGLKLITKAIYIKNYRSRIR